MNNTIKLILFIFPLCVITSQNAYSKSLGYGFEGSLGISSKNAGGYDFELVFKQLKRILNEKKTFKDGSSEQGFNYSGSGYRMKYTGGVFVSYRISKYIGVDASFRLSPFNSKEIFASAVSIKNYASQTHYYISIPLRIFKAYYLKNFAFTFGPELYFHLFSSKINIVAKGKKYTTNILFEGKKIKSKMRNFVAGFTCGLEYEIRKIGFILGFEYGKTLTGFNQNPYKKLKSDKAKKLSKEFKNYNQSYLSLRLGWDISILV